MTFKLDLTDDKHHALYTTARLLSEHEVYTMLYKFLGIHEHIEVKYPSLSENKTYAQINANNALHLSIIKSIKHIRFTNNIGSEFTIYNEERYHDEMSYGICFAHYVIGLYGLYKENIIKSDEVKWRIEVTMTLDDKKVYHHYFYNNHLTMRIHQYTTLIGKELILLYLFCEYLKINSAVLHKWTPEECADNWLSTYYGKKYPFDILNILTEYSRSRGSNICMLSLEEINNAIFLSGGNITIKVLGNPADNYNININCIKPYYPFSYFLIDSKTNKIKFQKGVTCYQEIITNYLRTIKPSDFPN